MPQAWAHRAPLLQNLENNATPPTHCVQLGVSTVSKLETSPLPKPASLLILGDPGSEIDVNTSADAVIQ